MPADRPLLAVRRAPPGDGGFTLVEVLVAIAVIGTVMTAVAPFLVQSLTLVSRQRGQQTRREWHGVASFFPMFTIRRLPRNIAIRRFHASSLLAAKKIENFRLADIGEGITECEIIKWSVKPASTVAAFDLLCEVQSDKASVEITSPFDGVVKDLLVKEGEIAMVGEGLCTIEVEEEDAKAAEQPSPSKSSTPTPEPVSSAQTEPPQEEVPRSLHPLDPKGEASPRSAKTGRDGAEVLATPSVRHFAKQKRVLLAQLAPGSGRGGRIEKRDIEAFLEGSSAAASSHAGASTKAPAGGVTVELGRTRSGCGKL